MRWKAANKLPRRREPGADGPRVSWRFALITAAVLLVAATLVFSAAGPDRSRTADYQERNPIPYSSNVPGPVGPVPNTAMPTAPRKP